MGLDLVVEGCPKPGHEQEWRQLLNRSFAGKELSEKETARFREISIPAYECIGAPRVGYDEKADEWILTAQQVKTAEEAVAVLKEFNGYYVVRLVQCDGISKYSNADMYDGVDETSFRGAYLNFCPNVLSKKLLNEAWGHKFPEEAVAYGKALLAAADSTKIDGIPLKPQRSFLSRLRFKKKDVLNEQEPTPIAEQLDIVRAAGRWFIFWGERGHAIRAYF